MVDSEWLKNLAKASFEGGTWHHPQPSEVQSLTAARVAEAIDALYDEARDGAEVFNMHATAPRTIRVLRLAPRAPDMLGGLTLLAGKYQLIVEYRPPHLEARLTGVRQWLRVSRPLYRFRAKSDAFGSVAWSVDNALLMTNELIMKKLFEELVRVAFPLVPGARAAGPTFMPHGRREK